jgi:hypothetical protein
LFCFLEKILNKNKKMNQQIENLNDYSNRKLMKSLYKSDSMSGSILQNKTKDLVVSITSNYIRPNNLMFPSNDSSISSKAVNTKKFKDLNESLILFDDDLNMTKKNVKRNESIFSCILIQQYFVYFVLCTFILLCSFGFYSVLITTNMRIESLENSLIDRISKNIPLKFISYKDYFADGNNQGKNYFIYSNDNLFDEDQQNKGFF